MGGLKSRLLALATVSVLSACGKPTVPMAPNTSPYFEPVSERLELGGTVYAYVDVDGDAEEAAEFVISILRDSPTLLKPELAQRLSAEDLVRVIGLRNVHAIGLSSYRDDPLFHNRAFIHQSGKREGLMRALGGEPSTFSLLDVAGEGSDLLWEQQVNFQAVLQVVKALSERGIGMRPGELAKTLDEPVLDLGFTLGELIDRLDTTLGVIAQIDEQRSLQVPGGGFWFAYFDFLVMADRLGFVVDALARRAALIPMVQVEQNERWLVIRTSFRLPPPWNAWQPAILKELATDRVYLVSTEAFLERTLSQASSVKTTSSFQRAFKELPATGNGIVYLSPRLTRQLQSTVDRLTVERSPTLATSLIRLVLPEADVPIGWVCRNEEQGVLFTSNTSSSHKSTLITLGLATLAPVVVTLGLSALARRSEPPTAPRVY